MIIRQEEEGPVSDLFYGFHVNEALELIKNCSEGLSTDTDLLKEACNETITILHDFIKKIEDLEKKTAKQNARNKVLEKLYRGHEND